MSELEKLFPRVKEGQVASVPLQFPSEEDHRRLSQELPFYDDIRVVSEGYSEQIRSTDEPRLKEILQNPALGSKRKCGDPLYGATDPKRNWTLRDTRLDRNVGDASIRSAESVDKILMYMKEYVIKRGYVEELKKNPQTNGLEKFIDMNILCEDPHTPQDKSIRDLDSITSVSGHISLKDLTFQLNFDLADNAELLLKNLAKNIVNDEDEEKRLKEAVKELSRLCENPNCAYSEFFPEMTNRQRGQIARNDILGKLLFDSAAEDNPELNWACYTAIVELTTDNTIPKCKSCIVCLLLNYSRRLLNGDNGLKDRDIDDFIEEPLILVDTRSTEASRMGFLTTQLPQYDTASINVHNNRVTALVHQLSFIDYKVTTDDPLGVYNGKPHIVKKERK